MGIGGLLNRAAADLYELARGNRIGELEKRRAVRAYGVDVSVNRGLWIALVVVLQLSQIGHREDTKPRTDHGFVVVERPIGQADAGIEVAKVRLPEASWHACLPIGHHAGARQRGRNYISCICRSRESRRRCVTGIKGTAKKLAPGRLTCGTEHY
jgi:hypothetical protein